MGIETTEGDYCVYIADCRYDNKNPDNVGIYQLGIIDFGDSPYGTWDENEEFSGFDRLGVYLPRDYFEEYENVK